MSIKISKDVWNKIIDIYEHDLSLRFPHRRLWIESTSGTFYNVRSVYKYSVEKNNDLILYFGCNPGERVRISGQTKELVCRCLEIKMKNSANTK